MMRILLSTTALAVVLGFAAPTSAEMCGSNVGQAPTTAQSIAQPAQSGGMCGGMMGQRQAIPTAEEQFEGKPAKPQQSAGMCGCCRNMAMMGGGQRGGQSGGMPSMEQPKPQ